MHLLLDYFTPVPRFTNFRYSESCKFIPIFQFTNIIFATTKSQHSFEDRATVSKVTNADEYISTQHMENTRRTHFLCYTYSIKVLINTIVYSLFT
jgi:hypothetical protein